jgi:L-2-amino-thiazoline-4-carboxylic acid hydrolase
MTLPSNCFESSCESGTYRESINRSRYNALDYSVRAQSQDACEIDVTGCRYAQFYKELGEPELGFLLVCGLDFPFAEGFAPDIKLTRTQTIMQGASHCDFRYKRQQD